MITLLSFPLFSPFCLLCSVFQPLSLPGSLQCLSIFSIRLEKHSAALLTPAIYLPLYIIPARQSRIVKD